MSELVIQTTHARKEYGLKVAVADLSLQVPQGEVFGFLGPNGAGKSTTVKMLLGLVKPTAGDVLVFGQSPANPAVRAQIGFLPEHFRFHEWLNATEFLTFHGRLYGLSHAELKTRVPELLKLVGLRDSARVRLSGFSKGMLQRVGLAQAMLNRPALIFLDEPTSGLDPLGRRLVRDIIHQLKDEGTTVFLNSHLLSEIEVTCDRVAFIKQGVVLQTNTMDELMGGQTEVTLRVDALTPPLLDALAQVGHSLNPNGRHLSLLVDDESRVPEVAALVHQHGARLYELRPQRKSLEERFVDIIGVDSGDGR